MGRRLSCWVVAVGLVFGIANVYGAQVGDTMEEVRARHGMPEGQMSVGDRAIWVYDGFSVEFEGGRVAQAPFASPAAPPGTDRATAPARARPRPAPARAPTATESVRASTPTERSRADGSRGEVLQDPGSLQAFRGRSNEVLRFRVTGSTSGPVWGTDVYTEDSMLAVAAVHAGVLKPGEQGVVRVRILPGRQSYQASTRHGVTSHTWGRWDASYSVESDDRSVR